MLSGNGTIDYDVEAHTLSAHKTSAARQESTSRNLHTFSHPLLRKPCSDSSLSFISAQRLLITKHFALKWYLASENRSKKTKVFIDFFSNLPRYLLFIICSVNNSYPTKITLLSCTNKEITYNLLPYTHLKVIIIFCLDMRGSNYIYTYYCEKSRNAINLKVH